MKCETTSKPVSGICLGFLSVTLFTLSACGGGGSSDSSTTIPPPIPDPESFELLDPTPGIAKGFGSRVLILANGNIVVSDTGDSSIAPDNGAVHLYDSIAQTLISSIYGDQAGDFLGERVTTLGNNNYVIASRLDDNGAIVDAGSVILVNGNTGTTIGTPWRGDQAGDGMSTGIRGLGNNNYVISAVQDDDGATVDAGSVRLVNGSTGETIGTPILGDQAGDLESIEITALGNNNYVVTATLDDDGATVNAGSVRLVDGNSGAVIGTPLVGDQTDDLLGNIGATALGNNNYVVASNNEGPVVTAQRGSVRLVDGDTGLPIGEPLIGDQDNDELGFGGVTALNNSHYVVVSIRDDDGTTVDAGSVRVINGDTGVEIDKVIGTTTDDLVNAQITVPAIGNYFVLSAANWDNNGQQNSGLVRLIAP